MPRKRRPTSPTFDCFDDDFDEEDTSSQCSKNDNPPVQRNAANARERARMRVLSSAFGRLKTKLPNIPPDTKLSKLDTLRLATMYIKQLKMIVDNDNTDNKDIYAENQDLSLNTDQCGDFCLINRSVQNMSWPFGFNHHHHHHYDNNSHHSATNSTTTNRQHHNFPYAMNTDWSEPSHHHQQPQHEQPENTRPYVKPFPCIETENHAAHNSGVNSNGHWYMANTSNTHPHTTCYMQNENLNQQRIRNAH